MKDLPENDSALLHCLGWFRIMTPLMVQKSLDQFKEMKILET